MKKCLLLSCGMLFIASVSIAETCADGSGMVIEGKVTGHKYCVSNKPFNWWNANAWCDALGRRLFERSDCACGNTTADCTNNMCPELNNFSNFYTGWMATPSGSSDAYFIHFQQGKCLIYPRSAYNAYDGARALCY